jgi:hypothetical protein
MSELLARAKVFERVSAVTGALAARRASSTARTRSARGFGQGVFAEDAFDDFVFAVFSFVSFKPDWVTEDPDGF